MSRRLGVASARRVLARFGRLDLPYRIGTPAAFSFALFNGRSPHDNVMDVMLSLTTSSALDNGCGPDPDRISDDLPHVDVVVRGEERRAAEPRAPRRGRGRCGAAP